MAMVVAWMESSYSRMIYSRTRSTHSMSLPVLAFKKLRPLLLLDPGQFLLLYKVHPSICQLRLMDLGPLPLCFYLILNSLAIILSTCTHPDVLPIILALHEVGSVLTVRWRAVAQVLDSVQTSSKLTILTSTIRSTLVISRLPAALSVPQ